MSYSDFYRVFTHNRYFLNGFAVKVGVLKFCLSGSECELCFMGSCV